MIWTGALWLQALSLLPPEDRDWLRMLYYAACWEDADAYFLSCIERMTRGF